MPTARRSIRGVTAGPPPTVWEGIYSVYISGTDCYFRDVDISSAGNVFACGRFAGTQQLALHKFDSDLNPLWQRNFRGADTTPSNEMWAIEVKGSDSYGFGQTQVSNSNTRGSAYHFNSSGTLITSEGLSSGAVISNRGCWVDGNGKFHVTGYRSDGGVNYPFYARYDATLTTLETQDRISSHNDSFGYDLVGGNANEVIIAIERRTIGAMRLMQWNYATDTLSGVAQARNSGNTQRVIPWGIAEYNGSIYVALRDGASRNGPVSGTVLRYDLNLNVQANRAYYGTNDTTFRGVAADADGVYICGDTEDTSGGAANAGYIVKVNATTLAREAELAFYHTGGVFFYGINITADAVYAVGILDSSGDRRAIIVKVNKDLNLSSISQTCNTDVSLVTPSVSEQAANLEYVSTIDTESATSFSELAPGYVTQSPTLIDDGPCEWNP